MRNNYQPCWDTLLKEGDKQKIIDYGTKPFLCGPTTRTLFNIPSGDQLQTRGNMSTYKLEGFLVTMPDNDAIFLLTGGNRKIEAIVRNVT